MGPWNCWEVGPSGWDPVMNKEDPVRIGRDLEIVSDGPDENRKRSRNHIGWT